MNIESFLNSAPTSTLVLIYLFILVLIVFAVTVGWKVYEKAGKQGWKAIIPYYNQWVFFEMSGKPGWWMLAGLLSMFNQTQLTSTNAKAYYTSVIIVSLPGIILNFVASLELGKRFGKSQKFSIINLGLFPFIGWPILAFSKAKYKLPARIKAI